MSEETVSPKSTDRSSRTIWERFAFTRKRLILLLAVEIGVCLILMGWLMLGGSSTPILDSPLFLTAILMGTFSTICIDYSRGLYGKTGKTALVISFLLALVWTTCLGIIGYAYRSLSASDLLGVWSLVSGVLLLIPGGTIFFITYLLWRTNNAR